MNDKHSNGRVRECPHRGKQGESLKGEKAGMVSLQFPAQNQLLLVTTHLPKSQRRGPGAGALCNLGDEDWHQLCLFPAKPWVPAPSGGQGTKGQGTRNSSGLAKALTVSNIHNAVLQDSSESSSTKCCHRLWSSSSRSVIHCVGC